MDKTIMAIIDWLSPSEGGRKNIPFGTKYGPIIKLKSTSGQQNIAWSAVIINEKFLSEFETIAQISFLVKDSLWELKTDTEFNLYEGNRLVATGRII